ncbi:MAG TPA: di-heme oxidoredictase family protein [Stellaceae bacterium]|nr:di-heme oxidoredictase family protein [Stellaceae bacterium]
MWKHTHLAAALSRPRGEAIIAALLLLAAPAALADADRPSADAIPAFAKSLDPGPRGGDPGAGGPLPGLGPDEVSFFNAAEAQFVTVDSVTGSIDGESGSGLGPRFNGNVCSACHIFPAVGGSSPPVNPLPAIAALDGATNKVPSFIKPNGPIREARFVRRPDGTRDGQVHNLFTITGRSDASGCSIKQPNFEAERANGNLALRIPTGLFGLGLVENVPDAALRQARQAHAADREAFGVAGHYNINANDGTIGRFGWKAQDKSLLIFSGEAYNVEQGVTNELFPNEREDDPGCRFTNDPEDSTFFVNTINSGSASSDLSSAAVNFAGFIRLSAPPAPAPSTASTTDGHQLFHDVGCESCHFETLTTGPSVYTGQSNVTFHPFSDFQVHNMGVGLRDGVVQGSAAGDEFRTAPLWGIGQRVFFLHDGRASNLVDAIEAHKSAGSEANRSINHFNALSRGQVQDILNYLRSL